MLNFTDANAADNLFGAADVLALVTDLLAQCPQDLALSIDGRAGLGALLSGLERTTRAGANQLVALQAQDRTLAQEEYQRGFGNGVAEGRRQGGEGSELLERMASILAEARPASGGPVPKLTEAAPEVPEQRGRAQA